MKILITGGNSSVGSSLKVALQHAHEVFTAGRRNCDIIWNWDDVPFNWECPSDTDVIIHTAAAFGGKKFSEIEETIKFNLLGSLKISEFAKINKVKHFINISSIYALIDNLSDYYSFYSLTKKQAEELLALNFRGSDIMFVNLRPSQLYGVEHSFSKHQPFLYSIIEKCHRVEYIELFGGKSPLRNYLFIDDFVEIIKRVIDYRVHGDFDCLFPENTNFYEIASITMKFFKTPEILQVNKDKPIISDNIFGYNDDLYKLISYTPKISIEEGIKKICAVYGK